MVLKPVITQSKQKTVDQDKPWYSGRERFTHHETLPFNKRTGDTFTADDGNQWETAIKVSLNAGAYVSERTWIFSLTPNNYMNRLSKPVVTDAFLIYDHPTKD